MATQLKKYQFWLIALVFLLLAACGSAGEADQSAASTSSLEEVDLVEPVHVSVTVDESRAVSQVVPITGGSLTATGADGSTYTLVIPGDALLNETQITMTPAEVTGMPAGFEAGPGVKLEPEGLNFFNFATLTITPASEIPIDQQILFGYEADGQNLSLALPEIDSSEIKIQVLHFTGFFVGAGKLENIAINLPQLGGAVVEGLRNKVAELTQRESQRQKIQGRKPLAPEYYNELAKLFQEYYDTYVKIRLDIAGESCAKGDLAILSYRNYRQMMQKVGIGASAVELDDLALVEKVADICLQEEYNLCVQDHIIHRMIPFWQGLERQMLLLRRALGLEEESATSSALLQKARQLTEKCLQFELQFESTAAGDVGPQKNELRVSAIVPIRFNASTFTFEGEGPLVQEYVQIIASTGGGCSNPTVTSGAASFEVFSFDWEVPPPKTELGEPGTKQQLGQVTDLFLEFDPEKTSETWGYNCPGATTPDVKSPHTYWHLYFTPAHIDEAKGAVYRFTDWQILGGELFAKKEWQKVAVYRFDIAGDQVETGSFTLYHRPK